MEGDFGITLQQMAYDLEKYDFESRDISPFILSEEETLRLFQPSDISTVIFNQSLRTVRSDDPDWDGQGILWHVGLCIPKTRILKRCYKKAKVLYVRDNEFDKVFKIHICN